MQNSSSDVVANVVKRVHERWEINKTVTYRRGSGKLCGTQSDVGWYEEDTIPDDMPAGPEDILGVAPVSRLLYLTPPYRFSRETLHFFPIIPQLHCVPQLASRKREKASHARSQQQKRCALNISIWHQASVSIPGHTYTHARARALSRPSHPILFYSIVYNAPLPPVARGVTMRWMWRGEKKVVGGQRKGRLVEWKLGRCEFVYNPEDR